MEIQRLVFPSKDRCEIETLTVPDEIGPSDVLVRNRFSLISAGTELACSRGRIAASMNQNFPMPSIRSIPATRRLARCWRLATASLT